MSAVCFARPYRPRINIPFFLVEETVKKYLLIAALSALTLGPGITQEKAGHASDKEHVVVRPDAIKWGPAPPALPPGAQMAVIVGDPSKKGSHYVIRAKFPDGYKVPPHWHPSDENVTV